MGSQFYNILEIYWERKNRMVKNGQFEAISVNSGNDIQLNQMIRNISKGYTNNKQYYIKWEGGAYPKTYIMEFSSFSSDDIVKLTFNQSFAPNQNFVMRQFGLTMNGATFQNDNTNNLPITIFKSTDGGDTWNYNSYVISSDPNDKGYIMDVFYLNSKYWVIYILHDDSTGSNSVKIGCISDNFATIHSGGGCFNENSAFAGSINKSGSHYYYVSYYEYLPSTYGFFEWSFSGSSSAYNEGQITDFEAPSTFNLENQIYWYKGKQRFLMHNEKFYWYDQISSMWIGLSVASPTDVNGVIWDKDENDEYIIPFVFWNNKIYKVFPNGSIESIQTPSGINAYVGYGSDINEAWFSTGSGIWQYKLSLKYSATSFTILKSKVKGEYLRKPSYSLSIDTKVFEKNDFAIFFDDEDNNKEVFEGWANQPLYKNGIFNIKFKSPLEIDLKTKVDETYTDQKASYILKDMLDKYAKYFHYTSTSINTSDSVITGTLKFKGDLKKVFDWANKSASNICYWLPNGEFHWDDGQTDSNIDITTSDVKSIDNKPDSLQINRVLARGGFVNGERLKKYAVDNSNPTGMKIIISYPHIIDETILQNYADSYISVQKQSVNRLTIKTTEKGYIQFGHQVDFQYNGEDPYINFPTLVKWYVMRSEYDFISKENTLILYDKLYYPTKKDEGKEDDAGTNPENNEELINQNAKDINDKDIGDLPSVDLTGLSDDDILVYDSASSKWKPEAPSGGGVQNPMTENLDAGGYDITNLGNITLDTNKSITVDAGIGYGIKFEDKASISARDVSGRLYVRNANDSAYANLYLGSLYVAGEVISNLKMATDKYITSSNYPAFRAWKSSSQSVSSATYTRVIFETEDYDKGGDFASGYRFTAPVDGIYHFDSYIMFNSATWSAGDLFLVNLYINGSREALLIRIVKESSQGMHMGGGGGTDWYMEAGDYAEIYVYQSTGSTLTLYNSNHDYCWFNGHLVRKI